MSDAPETLPGFWAFCWERLVRGADDPAFAFHRPALATRARSGGAEARIVVLRAVDAERHAFRFQTDLAASKVAELRADPRGSLLFWASAEKLQIRARLTFEVASGAETSAQWDAMPDGKRINYGGTPPTGAPIPAPDAYDKVPDRARFAIVTGTLRDMDAVHLGAPHRRALFRSVDGFAGTWLAP